LPTEGTFTELGVSIGAVTMKMMSSTSITSMNGTMLISFMERRRVPLREARADMGRDLLGSGGAAQWGAEGTAGCAARLRCRMFENSSMKVSWRVATRSMSRAKRL